MRRGTRPPKAPGATVTFAATSTGCTTPEYKFFVQPPGGSWTASTAFGANTWAWNTTGLANGVYGVGVWVRQSGSGGPYGGYWIRTYKLSRVHCTPGPVPAGPPRPQ